MSGSMRSRLWYMTLSFNPANTRIMKRRNFHLTVRHSARDLTSSPLGTWLVWWTRRAFRVRSASSEESCNYFEVNEAAQWVPYIGTGGQRAAKSLPPPPWTSQCHTLRFALGSIEQGIQSIKVDELWESTISAIGSRMTRQQDPVTSIRIKRRVVIETDKGAGAFNSLMSSQVKIENGGVSLSI